MITLIKNADVYAPEHLGKKDILIANDKIEKVADSIRVSGVECNRIDARGRKVSAGLIEKHAHVTGGGGEFGYESYATELQADDFLKVGTTTVVGLLGTDGVLKELTTLYAKVKALDTKMTAWMLTGSYAFPPKTITGEVDKDIIMIDKVIGCKLALSDDRGSFPTTEELARLISQCWRGGMTSRKAGLLHLHMGALSTGISQLFDIVKKYPRLLPHISITHCGRSEQLFNESCQWAKMGPNIDITTGGSSYLASREDLVVKALESGVSVDHITLSSDGGGGIRHIDPTTGEEWYGTATVDCNLKMLVNLVTKYGLKFEDVLKFLTTNVAREYGFTTKGQVAPGFDADLIIWNDNFSINKVMAKGKLYQAAK